MSELNHDALKYALSAATIHLENNGEKAYLSIQQLPGRLHYCAEDIIWILKQKNITTGIDADAIASIIENELYKENVLVAQGIPPEDGKDGYYEYYFEQNDENKPRVLEDGSVDYHIAGRIKVVQGGDVVARYIPATSGCNGLGVTGALLPARPGRELKPLRGSGFTISDDGRTYTASHTGKATVSDGILNIKNILEISGSLDNVLGTLDFDGDVIIRGDVMQGVTVRALGNITVCGTVEPSTLIAGKDIVLQCGTKGGGIGILQSGGNVSGKFFEQVQIIADGNVTANYILSCNVKALGTVEASGSRGSIIGGSITAGTKIMAGNLGNRNETKTILSAGDKDSLIDELDKTEEAFSEGLKRLNELENALKDLVARLGSGINRASEKDRTLLAEKIKLSNNMTMLNNRKQLLRNAITAAPLASIAARKIIYPGTVLIINGIRHFPQSEISAMTAKSAGSEITFVPNI